VKKILIFNSLYAPDGKGGAERSTQILAESLVKSGFEVLVVCTAKKDIEENIDSVQVKRIAGLNIAHLDDLYKLNIFQKFLWHFIDAFNLKSILKINPILKEFDPDIIHTNNLTGFSCTIWLLAKINKIKIIHTLRDYYLVSVGSANANRPLSDFLFKSHIKMMANFVDYVVGNSKFILDFHIDKGFFKNAKKNIVFNAFVPKNVSEKKYEKKYLFLGTLTDEKGIDLLCRAFEELNNDGYDICLYVAGEGDRRYTKSLIHKYESQYIKFIGYIDSSNAYNLCSWVIVPSIWDEPLSRTCFEPLFYGVPVISSDAGGNKEVIMPNKNGLIFLRNNIQDLKHKIIDSLSVDYKEFSKNALMTSNKFTTERLTANYKKIYEEI
tara:strand:+ start:6526 stop:7668 length:1143 start_codon:yes stop_codon:yes gene_type:complete